MSSDDLVRHEIEEEEEDEEEDDEYDMMNRAGCGLRGPECEDLKTRFPKIRSTQQSKRKNKKKTSRRKDDQDDSELCDEKTRDALNLPEISATAARMAKRDASDESFTLKQLFQRAIWNAMRNDKMDHLKTIADEASKAGISSIAKLASALYVVFRVQKENFNHFLIHTRENHFLNIETPTLASRIYTQVHPKDTISFLKHVLHFFFWNTK